MCKGKPPEKWPVFSKKEPVPRSSCDTGSSVQRSRRNVTAETVSVVSVPGVWKISEWLARGRRRQPAVE